MVDVVAEFFGEGVVGGAPGGPGGSGGLGEEHCRQCRQSRVLHLDLSRRKCSSRPRVVALRLCEGRGGQWLLGGAAKERPRHVSFCSLVVVVWCGGCVVVVKGGKDVDLRVGFGCEKGKNGSEGLWSMGRQ